MDALSAVSVVRACVVFGDDVADEVIGSVTSQLTQLPQPFVAVYTAVKAHEVRVVTYFRLTNLHFCLVGCSCQLLSSNLQLGIGKLPRLWSLLFSFVI